MDTYLIDNYLSLYKGFHGPDEERINIYTTKNAVLDVPAQILALILFTHALVQLAVVSICCCAGHHQNDCKNKRRKEIVVLRTHTRTRTSVHNHYIWIILTLIQFKVFQVLHMWKNMIIMDRTESIKRIVRVRPHAAAAVIFYWLHCVVLIATNMVLLQQL